MKDFCDNLKAFAILTLTLFRNGDDENKITVGEFARVHAKKFFAVAVFGVMLTMVSCGAEEKFFGVTGEEFMQRYNDNLSIFKSTSNAKLFYSLKVDGVRHLKFKTGDVTFVSLQTQQNYLAMELTAQPDMVHVHWSLNDENPAHVADFKVMSGVAAYSIDGSDDPKYRRFQETAEVIDALFDQFQRGNVSPTITHKGITYSLGAGMGDFGGSLKSESIWFTAKRSNK